mgnify:CR=1 FL=1
MFWRGWNTWCSALTMDMGVKKGEVPEAARKAGFTKVETRVETLCSGVQEIHVIRK